MTTPTTSISKESAAQAVTEIIKDLPSNYELVPFKNFRASSKLRSDHYEPFEVLCYKNTRKSSGWLVCVYVKTKGCELRSGLMVFNHSKGGTGKFERHTKARKNGPVLRLNLERPLPALSKASITRAAAYAVALDLRPISFTDNKKGIRMFVNAVFQAGQNTQPSDRIDPKSYLPCATSVLNSLKEVANDNRDEYKWLLDKMYETSGALTIDGVTLKVQERQFYDFTLHFVDVIGSSPWDKEHKVEIKVVTLLLKEKPETGDAYSLRNMLGRYLKEDKDIRRLFN